MYCAPITFLHYFKEHKYYFKEHKGGGGQHPRFMFLKYCKNVVGAQNILIRIFCPNAYIFNRGVDAPQANLLKKPCHNLEFYTILYEKFTISYSALSNLLTQREICTEKCRIKTFLYRLVGKVCTDRPDVFLFLCTNRASGV